MQLRHYLQQAPRGTAAAIAKALDVRAVMVSQWAAGTKPVPEDRAPGLEAATSGAVPCEETCPDARWVRVDSDGWPNGKPLLDKSPAPIDQRTADLGPAARRQEG